MTATVQRSKMIERVLAGVITLAFLLQALPATGASPESYPPQTDPQGDASVFGVPTVPTTSTPVTAPYDLVEFGMTGEDELGFHLYFQVVSFKGDPTNTGFLFGGGVYQIFFKLEGSRTRYQLTTFPGATGATENPTGVRGTNVDFCLFHDENSDPNGGPRFVFSDCYRQRISATIDYDKNRFDAYITKDALMGRVPDGSGAPPFALPTVSKGSRLSDVYVTADRNFPTFMADRLPDQDYARPIVLERDAANSRIRIGLDTGAPKKAENLTTPPDPNAGGGEAQLSNRVSVTPGVPTLVRLRVENTNAANRVVNLSAEVPKSENSEKFSVQIAPAIRVPAGESRVVNLIVNASAKAQHRDGAVVVVRGESLGFAGEIGAVRLELVASTPPSPEHKTLYFHAAPQDRDTFSETVCTALPFCGGDDAWMNTLEKDAQGTSDAGTRMFLTSFGGSGGLAPGYGIAFRLDTPLASPIVLDPAQPIHVKLGFKTSAEFGAQVSFDVSTLQTNRLVATGSSSVAVRDGQPVEFTVMPMQDSARIEPTDGPLLARITLRSAASGTGAAALLPTFMFVPSQSQIVLPLVADPNAGKVSLSAGPALISLSVQTDSAKFVNPGRATLYNLTVVNEGIDADDARLEVLYDNPEWRVDLFPGSRFHLASGDAGKFALLAHAPSTAKENDQLHILINATSTNDPHVQSQMRLIAIVITKDTPDESHYYMVDSENSAKIVKQAGHNTPGFELVLLVVAVGALALRRRKA